MNISKREKQWLFALGILLVAFLYYQFVYSYLDKALADKSTQEQQIIDKFNKAQDTINNMENQKSNVKIMNAKISKEAFAVYPTVTQEYVILEIDKLLKANHLEGGMEFDAIVLDPVEAIKKSELDKGVLESTMQGVADKYNDKYGNKKEEDKSNNEVNNNKKDDKTTDKTKSNDTSNTSNSTPNNTNNNNTTNNNGGTNTKENKVIKMKGKVKFYGTYENVTKFVKDIKALEKNKICLFGIGMGINDTEWVNGELGIGIYSVPKLDLNSNPALSNSISEYLRWTLNNAYGKTEPFKTDQAAGSKLKVEKPTSDFTISTKGTNSDLPTVMMGKSDDSLRTTYLYVDKNNKQEAEIVLSKQGDKYYYKYKIANSSVPVDYNGNGIEFTPCNSSIIITALSEKRTGDNDKAGVNLKIVNNTGMLVRVEVSGDDNANPRISINGDRNNISVSQK